VSTALENRLARLEAAEAIRAAMFDYAAAVDAGHIDEAVQLYVPDVAWSGANMPFGTGKTLTLSGREQVAKMLSKLPAGSFRHHALNMTVDVDDDATSASSRALMLVVSRSPSSPDKAMVLGGLYRARWVRAANLWQVETWHVSNQWLVDGTDVAFFNAVDAWAETAVEARP
jgi:ketosteroid isomerase-like protein